MVYAEALSRRNQGDTEGAIERLGWLYQQGDTEAATLFHLALAHELEEDFQVALSVYDLLLSEHKDRNVEKNAGFRRALCLMELGANRAAIRQLQRSGRGEVFDAEDRYTYDLATGVAWIRAGREAKGLPLVENTLAATEGTEMAPWMRAMGWHALAALTLRRAEKLSLSVRPSKAAQNLQLRATMIAEAERYLIQVVTLSEPDWILAGMLDLGDAYLAVHSDLLAAPAPRGFSEEEKRYYREAMAREARSVLVKAWRSYDQGIELAGRFARLESKRARELRARRDAINLSE